MKINSTSWLLIICSKINGDIHEVLSLIDKTIETSAVSYQSLKNKWHLELYFKDKPSESIIERMLFTFKKLKYLKRVNYKLILLKEKDWLKENLDSFPPVLLDNFIFYSNQYRNKTHINKKNIILNSSMAFGSGSHPTTRGCIMALKFLSKNFYPFQVLDLGSGSGILSIVAKNIWKSSKIIALDNDVISVKTTLKNLKKNNLCMKIKVGLAKTFKPYGGFNFLKFDLIIANIFAKTLKRMLFSKITIPSDKGFLVLSGILENQKNDVLNIYRIYGFKNIKNFYIDGWITIVMRKL